MWLTIITRTSLKHSDGRRGGAKGAYAPGGTVQGLDWKCETRNNGAVKIAGVEIARMETTAPKCMGENWEKGMSGTKMQGLKLWETKTTAQYCRGWKMCASVTSQYNLVPAKGRWCSAAGKVTTGLAESNGNLPPGGWLTVTCGLTASLGSVPSPTLGIEYGKSYLLTARRSYASAILGVVILFVCPSVTRVLCD